MKDCLGRSKVGLLLRLKRIKPESEAEFVAQGETVVHFFALNFVSQAALTPRLCTAAN